MHGHGVLTRSDGTISYEGLWKDGEKDPGGMTQSQSSPPHEQSTSVLELTKLYFSVDSAAHLPSTSSSPPNPYVVLNFGGQNHITKTLLSTFDPQWEQEIGEFKVPSNASSVVCLPPISASNLGKDRRQCFRRRAAEEGSRKTSGGAGAGGVGEGEGVRIATAD